MALRNKRIATSLAVSLGAWAIVPNTGSAQTAPNTAAGTQANEGELSTVVVTAQRREQNLQEVPIAVTAFTPEQLASQQITTTLNLDRYVPNMFASNNVGQGSANVYYVRALGQTQSFPTFEPQVSTYVDDIYLARQNANNLSLFGVESVQVLNGPQGTLFGRNSTGGAIVVTLTRPSQKFGADVELNYGQVGDSWADVYSGRASLDLPISDKFLTRTSVYGITDNGYVDAVTTGERLNSTNNFGVREALAILPTENLRWDIEGDYERNNDANLLNQPGPDANRISYTGFSTTGGALLPYLTGEK